MNISQDYKDLINEHTVDLIKSLKKFKLSLYYRKINLSKYNLNEEKLPYSTFKHILNKLSKVIRCNETIENIVLVQNQHQYELYMVRENEFTKFLSDKGMKILLFSDRSYIKDLRIEAKRVLSDENNYEQDSYNSKRRKIHDENSKFISKKDTKDEVENIEIIIDKTPNSEEDKQINSDDKITKLLQSLTNEEKNNVIHRLTGDIKFNEKDKQNIIIEKKEINTPKNVPIKKKNDIDNVCKNNIINQKRTTKKIMRYHEQYF